MASQESKCSPAGADAVTAASRTTNKDYKPHQVVPSYKVTKALHWGT